MQKNSLPCWAVDPHGIDNRDQQIRLSLELLSGGLGESKGVTFQLSYEEQQIENNCSLHCLLFPTALYYLRLQHGRRSERGEERRREKGRNEPRQQEFSGDFSR